MVANFFFINYGLILYGDFDDIFIRETLPNPIEYTYFKDISKYSEEKEFRISLSCKGMGIYRVNGNNFNFPESIMLEFDLREATKEGVLKEILISKEYEKAFIDETERRANLKDIRWIVDN